jgi:hypothetical protein
MLRLQLKVFALASAIAMGADYIYITIFYASPRMQDTMVLMMLSSVITIAVIMGLFNVRAAFVAHNLAKTKGKKTP